MAKEIKNIGASVRARLLNLSKANGQSFDLVLTRFALERLLFRLSQSPHADRFVLKGAMLMMSWFDDPHRGTRDLDLLGFGDPSEAAMLATFRDILAQDAEDGVVFDPDTLRVDRIREELDYGGLRLRAIASVGGARINLTIDIGFGDALEPGAEVVDYPAMIDQIGRAEEHTSELQSLMRISYAVFCLKKKKNTKSKTRHNVMKNTKP